MIYSHWKEVPIVEFAMVSHDHPDLEIIKEAYKMAGAGLGIDYASSFKAYGKLLLVNKDN